MPTPKTIVLLLALALSATLLSACGSGGASGASGPILRRCPQHSPEIPESTSIGTEGDTAPKGAIGALICRWDWSGTSDTSPELTEHTVHGWPAERLVRTLNTLSPPPEGEFSCEEISGELIYLVGLRYPGESGVQIQINESGCGSVVNIQSEDIFSSSPGLRRELDRDLEEP